MSKDKYALLDTDFISKMYSIEKDADNHLIDRIMELPQYQFYCHNQIREEMGRHHASGAAEWLKEKISRGRITCYSDEDILNELEFIYGTLAPAIYVELLKTACEAYRTDYYYQNFKCFENSDNQNFSKKDFLGKLNKAYDKIGMGYNLGEIKTYILLQMLTLLYGEQIFVFCSDDRNARNGIVSIGGARCVSVLSSFLRLKKERNFQLEDASPYIQSWINFCKERHQLTFRIQDNSKEKRIYKVSCEQVMREIYEEKLEELMTGNLRYK